MQLQERGGRTQKVKMLADNVSFDTDDSDNKENGIKLISKIQKVLNQGKFKNIKNKNTNELSLNYVQ